VHRTQRALRAHDNCRCPCDEPKGQGYAARFVVCKRTYNDGNDVLPHPCHGPVSSSAGIIGTEEGNDGMFAKRNAWWHHNELTSEAASMQTEQRGERAVFFNAQPGPGRKA
jgi:hypothetical protein